MHPIYTYRITRALLGYDRYQAECDDMPVRFCRRGLTPEAARRKLARDIGLAMLGRSSAMQRVWLPLFVPLRRRADRLAQRVERARRSRRARL